MKKIAVIQGSLREGSHTNIACRKFEEKCKAKGIEVGYFDLRDYEMQFCDGRKLEEYNSDLNEIYKKVEVVEAVIFGMPVYQYSMSGVLKNFLDICGGSLKGKHIGVIVNSGGPNCYMASRDILDCLYYEYGTTNISPTPYSWFMDFKDGELVNEKTLSKLDELVEKIESL